MLIKELLRNETACRGEIMLKDVTHITSDFRAANKSSLLFLLPGVNFDTYELIPSFIKSSPMAIVTEDASRFPKTSVPLIEVRSSRRAYAYAHARINKIDFACMKFIGVTGTNGKTSTATLINRVLQHSGLKTGFIGTGKIMSVDTVLSNECYSMTCPDPDVLYPAIAKMQCDGCSAVVMEVSSHALELSKTDPIPFSIGIFTGLSHDHLEFHGSMENYFNSKEKLISAAKEAIINFDDPWGKKLYEKYREKSTGIGVVWRSDRTATEVESFGLSGIGYVFKSANFLTRINLPLPGFYNVYNSMLAFEAAYKMNIAPRIIKEALISADCIEGRFERINGDITVIIDYAHTPLALESLLKTTCHAKEKKQKIWLVFGCGGNRDKTKRPIMAEIAEKYADRIIVTNDNPRNEAEEYIISDIVSGFKNANYGVIYDRELAIRTAIKKSDDKDIVIIAGKGHERYIIDAEGYHPFDERSIVASALNDRSEARKNEV